MRKGPGALLMREVDKRKSTVLLQETGLRRRAAQTRNQILSSGELGECATLERLSLFVRAVSFLTPPCF